MNQTKTKSSFAPKQIIISLILQLLVFFLLLGLFPVVLLKIPHFENYLPVASWIILIGLSVFNAIFSRKFGKPAVLYAAVNASILSLLGLCVGLIVYSESFQLLSVLLRYGIYILLSLCLALFFETRFKKKKHKGGNFRFSK